jgi:hypothetical protein
MTGQPGPETTEHADAAGAGAESSKEMERLREERDHLLAHTRNLEAQLRSAARDPARIRDLEQRLAQAEALLRHISVVRMARWLVLQPDAALQRVGRKLRDGVGWLVLDRYRRFRLKQRGSRA